MTVERSAGTGIARLVATVALIVPAIIGATASSSRADAGDTLWTTGLGADGQLGNATTASRTTFGPVPGLDDADAVTGGREHLVALVGGTVWTWGDGSKGATGLGSLTDRSTPAQVPGLGTVTSIAAGHYHTLALMADGSVRAWGYNAMGQLGDGTLRKRLSPVPVKGLSNVVDIAAGRDMSYALLTDAPSGRGAAVRTASSETARGRPARPALYRSAV
jgi:alpha-tubulin suppressor-like RCC1 family protein